MDDVEDDIRAARSGDDEAFCRLVEAHQAMVRGYVARFVLHAEDAFDLAQETFIDAHRSLGDFEPGRDFGRWLRGIARHRCLTALRSAARRRRHEADAMAHILQQRMERELQAAEAERSAELVSRLHDCLERLRRRQGRRVRLLDLHYFEGRTIRETAAVEGMTEAAVAMALSRLRRALAACLRRGIAGGEPVHG